MKKIQIIEIIEIHVFFRDNAMKKANNNTMGDIILYKKYENKLYKIVDSCLTYDQMITCRNWIKQIFIKNIIDVSLFNSLLTTLDSMDIR